MWTLVPWKAGKLVITPYTTEVKDRYWTLGRSALVRCDLPKGKHLALDGRLASKAPAVSSGSPLQTFSIFWAIDRTTAKADANLTLEYAKVNLNIGVEFPKGRKRSQTDSTIEVPYLVNPKEIPAHTRLIAIDDVQLQKLHHAK